MIPTILHYPLQTPASLSDMSDNTSATSTDSEMDHSPKKRLVPRAQSNSTVARIDLNNPNLSAIAQNFYCSPTYLANLVSNVKTIHESPSLHRDSATPWRSAYTPQTIASWEQDLRYNGGGIDEGELNAQIAHLKCLAAMAMTRERSSDKNKLLEENERSLQVKVEEDEWMDDEVVVVGGRQSRKKR